MFTGFGDRLLAEVSFAEQILLDSSTFHSTRQIFFFNSSSWEDNSLISITDASISTERRKNSDICTAGTIIWYLDRRFNSSQS